MQHSTRTLLWPAALLWVFPGAVGGCEKGRHGGSDDTATCPVCQDPQTLLDDQGQPTGFEQCADGAIDRVTQQTSSVPVVGNCHGDEDSLGCSSDADCGGDPLAVCAHWSDWGGGGGLPVRGGVGLGR